MHRMSSPISMQGISSSNFSGEGKNFEAFGCGLLQHWRGSALPCMGLAEVDGFPEHIVQTDQAVQ